MLDGVDLFALTALTILGQIGIELGPLIGEAGVVGIALVRTQSLVRDFIAGMFMLIEDQYGVGDIVDVGEAAAPSRP